MKLVEKRDVPMDPNWPQLGTLEKTYIAGVKGEDIAERLFSMFIGGAVLFCLVAIAYLVPLLPVVFFILFLVAWASLKFPLSYRIVKREEGESE